MSFRRNNLARITCGYLLVPSPKVQCSQLRDRVSTTHRGARVVSISDDLGEDHSLVPQFLGEGPTVHLMAGVRTGLRSPILSLLHCCSQKTKHASALIIYLDLNVVGVSSLS